MNRNLLILLLVSGLLQACAPAGPVRFYAGQPVSDDKLAIVVVPGPITVHSIDGTEIDSPSQENVNYELHLKPGFHLIAFKYELYWGTPVSGMLVKSKLTGVDTNFQAGKRYHINYRQPSDEDEAYTFLRKFRASLIEPSSGQQFSSYEIEDLNTVLQTRRSAFYKTHPSVSTDYIAKAVPDHRVQEGPPAVVQSNAMPDADTAVKENPVKRLKFWWLMANEQERKAFIEWTRTATETFGEN